MSLVAKALSLIGLQRKGISTSEQLLAVIASGMTARTGVTVTPSRALECVTVLACVRAIAEGIAMPPVKLYRETASGRELMKDDPRHRLVARRPNAWQTPMEFRETLVMHAVLCGGGFAYINRTGDNVARELLPLQPGRVRPVQSADGRSIAFEIRRPDGSSETVAADRVLHLRGPSWDSVAGLPAVKLAREAIGLSIGAEQVAANQFGQGVTPSGVIEATGGLSPDGMQVLRDEVQRFYGGIEKAGTALILDAGMAFKELVADNEKRQFLETRKWQVEEICRALRVYPVVIGFSDKAATFASVEQFTLMHVVHTLGPWFTRLEQALGRDLLGPDDGDLYFRFSVAALLRGDSKTRGEFYTKLFNMAAINPNEIRELEEMAPYDGGDRFYWPVNMAPADPDADPPVDPDAPKEPE